MVIENLDPDVGTDVETMTGTTGFGLSIDASGLMSFCFWASGAEGGRSFVRDLNQWIREMTIRSKLTQYQTYFDWISNVLAAGNGENLMIS